MTMIIARSASSGGKLTCFSAPRPESRIPVSSLRIHTLIA